MRLASQIAILILAHVAQAAPSAVTQPANPLRTSWEQSDHPSGIYHAKDAAKLDVIIENLTPEPQSVEGEIAFGEAPDAPAEFKPLSITPLTSTILAPHERAKIPLALTFAAAGEYQLRWIRPDKSSTRIDNPADIPLQAIFAPRTPPGSPTPWLIELPRQAALVPGYLPDYLAQTTVQKFLLDERFAFDPKTNIGLAVGASMGISDAQSQTLFADVAKAKASIVLRVAVPLADPGRKREAFRKYIADAAARMHGTLKAIAIVPDPAAPAPYTPAQRAAYRAYYLAAYEEAKHADKTIVMLGAGSAQATGDLLFSADKSASLRPYLDAAAVTDVTSQPTILKQALGPLAENKLPLWVLPQPRANQHIGPAIPPAAALAQDAVVVPLPPPNIDRGVTAHLLGGAVFFRQVHPKNLPYVAVFQGDGYAVAAVAGPGAGAPIDGQFPSLATRRFRVTPSAHDDKPLYPNVEVPDDTHSMRAVSCIGSPINCRTGDSLFVPATDQVVYILQAGTADDLSSLLEPAANNRLPLLTVTASLGSDAQEKSLITLHLTNITLDPLAGTIKLILPTAEPAGEPGKPEPTLAEATLPPLAAGKSTDLPLPITDLPAGASALIVELTTAHATQTIAIPLVARTRPPASQPTSTP